MTITAMRPTNEASIQAFTTSIATTPVAGAAVVTNAGYVQRVFAAAAGTTTGTITVAVAINGGSDICNSLLLIAPASNARNNPAFELTIPGAGSTSGVFVSEGDCVTFTPSGGTGSSIQGAFGIVVRNV